MVINDFNDSPAFDWSHPGVANAGLAKTGFMATLLSMMALQVCSLALLFSAAGYVHRYAGMFNLVYMSLALYMMHRRHGLIRKGNEWMYRVFLFSTPFSNLVRSILSWFDVSATSSPVTT